MCVYVRACVCVWVCVSVCLSLPQEMCVRVCVCSVLQYVAVCCSVWQCVAMCWAVCVKLLTDICCIVLQCGAVCCSLSQYVAVCCSVLQCVAVCGRLLRDTCHALLKIHYIYIYMHIYIYIYIYTWRTAICIQPFMRVYGVATITRLLKIIGLFCKRALWQRLYSANESYILKALRPSCRG